MESLRFVVRFVVYSDFLCPWCFTGASRLWRLVDAHTPRVELEWRSYLLRPRPRAGRDPEKFRAYTERWAAGPGADEDAPTFRSWRGDANPPSHSLPAQVVGKAAWRERPEAYRGFQTRMFEAYFQESRDVSDEACLRELWTAAGFGDLPFPDLGDPELVRAVMADHEQALVEGGTGVPAVRRERDELLIVGAQPYAVYDRWVSRTLADE